MMRSFSAIALSVLLLVQISSATQELSSESFKALMDSGKNGMVKFFQPWCGHCTRMKPDWDKLADEAHPSVFIADVNCSDEADLCQENSVQGYPTIKVYTDGEEAPYNGGRSFEEMSSFVDENLAVKCDVSQPSTCSAKSQKYIEKWQSKAETDVKKEVARLQGLVGKDMTLELTRWLKERIIILKQISPETPEL